MTENFIKHCIYVNSTITYNVGVFEVKFISDEVGLLTENTIGEVLREMANHQSAPIAEVKRAIYRKFGIRINITISRFVPFGECMRCESRKKTI